METGSVAAAPIGLADSAGDLESYLPLYERSLWAANKAPTTVYKYVLTVRQLIPRSISLTQYGRCSLLSRASPGRGSGPGGALGLPLRPRNQSPHG
jgi:hypothetical protein